MPVKTIPNKRVLKRTLFILINSLSERKNKKSKFSFTETKEFSILKISKLLRGN